MERYSAAKRRREVKESVEMNSCECSDEQNTIVYPSNTECVDIQTNLTRDPSIMPE